MAKLRLVPPSGPPIEISKDEALVGREPSCDVVLSDGSVSRKHARIEKRGTEWVVVDQGSANGTFLDSKRVAEVVLVDGQELRFGALGFRVEIEGADLAATVAGISGPEATVVSTPPPMPPRPAVPPPLPKPPAPPRPSPPPPSAAAARERFRSGSPPAPGSPVPQMASPPPPRKGKGPVFWIGTGCCGCLLLVLLLGAILGGAVFFMTRGAVDTVQDRLGQIKAGRLDEAYEGLSESYRRQISRRQFERMVAAHPTLRDHAEASFWPPVGSVKVENDVAHLTGVLVSTSGQKETVGFELVKEKGAWKISAIRFEEGEETSAVEDPATPELSGGGALETETVELSKEPTGDGTHVAIKTRTRGFALRREGRAFRIDLLGDLETRAPGGLPIASLSKPGFYRLNETTRSAEGAYADFKTDLTFSRAPAGTYEVRITIRDRVGGGQQTHRVSFDLP